MGFTRKDQGKQQLSGNECTLNESEYSWIHCFTTYKIWKFLEALLEGTSQVKYENFTMKKKDESIFEINSRFTCIINDLANLAEPMSEKN